MSRTPDLTDHIVAYRAFVMLADSDIAGPYRTNHPWGLEVDNDGWITATCDVSREMREHLQHMNRNIAESLKMAADYIREAKRLAEARQSVDPDATRLDAATLRAMSDQMTVPESLFAREMIGSRSVADGAPRSISDYAQRLKSIEDNMKQAAKVVARGGEHDAPGHECGCGLYALHSPKDVPFTGMLHGLVQAKGVIEVHGSGIRAEKMRLVAIAPGPCASPHTQASNPFTKRSYMSAMLYGQTHTYNDWKKTKRADRSTLKTLRKEIASALKRIHKNAPDAPKVRICDSTEQLVELASEFGTPVPHQLLPGAPYGEEL